MTSKEANAIARDRAQAWREDRGRIANQMIYKRTVENYENEISSGNKRRLWLIVIVAVQFAAIVFLAWRA